MSHEEVETETADFANLGLVQNIHSAELRLAGAAKGDRQPGLRQRGKHHLRVTWSGLRTKQEVSKHLTPYARR